MYSSALHQIDAVVGGTHATKTTPSPSPMQAIQATKKSRPVGHNSETIWFSSGNAEVCPARFSWGRIVSAKLFESWTSCL